MARAFSPQLAARRARLVALVAAVILCALAGLARASGEAAIDLVVLGECPTDEAVRDQIDGIAAPGAAITMRIDRRSGISAVEISVDHTAAVEREIESDDCEAVAEAFALILRAHLMTLAGAESDDDVDPVREPPAIGEIDRTEKTMEMPSYRAPSVAEGDRGVRWRADLALSTEVVPRTDVTERARDAARGNLQEMEASAAARLVGPIGARLSVGATTWSDKTTMSGPVELRAGYARAYLLGRKPGRLWNRDWYGEAAAGAGVWLAKATAVDVEGQPSALSAHPSGELGLSIGLRIAGPVWLCTGVRGARLFARERHEVATDTAIETPGSHLAAMAGLSWRLERGSSTEERGR